MTGFSFIGAISVVIALLAILFIAPAEVRKTSNQIISTQVAYGGGFIALFASLITVLMYIWLYTNGELKAWVPEFIVIFWSSFQSSIFGAVYWVFLCLYFVEKRRTKAGIGCLIGWPVLMLFLNYLPALYRFCVETNGFLAPSNTVTDLIASMLIIASLVLLSFSYYKNKHHWAEL